jgi:hypothetical protein
LLHVDIDAGLSHLLISAPRSTGELCRDHQTASASMSPKMIIRGEVMVVALAGR